MYRRIEVVLLLPLLILTAPALRAQPQVETPRPLTAALLAPVLGIALLALSACNTMEGFGQDMENAGEEIEEEAEET